jgi:hypothetical protein
VTSESELQTGIAKFLLRRRDLTKDEEAKAFARKHIAGNARVSPVEQLETYREQYWWRHTGSLVEDFQGVGGILGQSDWERLVVEYLTLHPPTTFSLRELGEQLPDFVLTREWLPHRELVGDMARLEWSHVEVFDAPEAQPLAPEKLRAVPESAWESVRLVPNPALRLLRLAYPVLELRRKLLAPESATGSGDEPIPLPSAEAQHLAVCRTKLAIEHHLLDPGAFALLSKLCRSIPLGVACESARAELSLSPEALAAELESWFATWTARGYFVDLSCE